MKSAESSRWNVRNRIPRRSRGWLRSPLEWVMRQRSTCKTPTAPVAARVRNRFDVGYLSYKHDRALVGEHGELATSDSLGVELPSTTIRLPVLSRRGMRVIPKPRAPERVVDPRPSPPAQRDVHELRDRHINLLQQARPPWRSHNILLARGPTGRHLSWFGEGLELSQRSAESPTPCAR